MDLEAKLVGQTELEEALKFLDDSEDLISRVARRLGNRKKAIQKTADRIRACLSQGCHYPRKEFDEEFAEHYEYGLLALETAKDLIRAKKKGQGQ